MKIFFIFLLVYGLASSNQSKLLSNLQSPSPVEYVNPTNFSGLWYEIARTYNSFEKDCVAATVEYILNKDNTYKVKNRCFKNEIGGELIIYNGDVEPLQKDNMAQMKSTYFWIFSKNYQIIHLEDYEFAVMSDEEMDNVWIMNRKPFLEKEKLNSILKKLQKYMDTKRFIFTVQDEKGRYK